MFTQIPCLHKDTCYAHALAIALDIDVYKVFVQARRWVKRLSDGMYLDDIEAFAKRYTTATSFDTNITLKKFLENNPKGTFIVANYSHAFAVVDGRYYDFKERNRFVIKWVLIIR